VEVAVTKSICAALLAGVLLSGVAAAADYIPYAAPPAAKPYWQGPYVGVNLGYQWGGVSNSGSDPSGVTGGAQAGYSWQFGQFVFGAETDVQGSSASDRFAAWKFSNPWFGTLRARGGIVAGNALFYGTIGLAYGTLQLKNMLSGVWESHTDFGWAGGAGAEVALTGNWTAKAEYLYVDLDSSPYVLTGNSHGISSNVLRLGVNYRF
jgi:outer membrane immunogenic protein